MSVIWRLCNVLKEIALDDLAENLEGTHPAPTSALRAVQSVVGWLNSHAACSLDLGVEAVYARVEKVAQQYAFEELLYPGEVQELAGEAVQRWEDARHAARTFGSTLPA